MLQLGYFVSVLGFIYLLLKELGILAWIGKMVHGKLPKEGDLNTMYFVTRSRGNVDVRLIIFNRELSPIRDCTVRMTGTGIFVYKRDTLSFIPYYEIERIVFREE
jgi:hypothetical protein